MEIFFSPKKTLDSFSLVFSADLNEALEVGSVEVFIVFVSALEKLFVGSTLRLEVVELLEDFVEGGLGGGRGTWNCLDYYLYF